MSHANASGDLAVVVERALEVLIQKLERRHFGQTGKRGAASAAQTSQSHAEDLSPMAKVNASDSRTASPSSDSGDSKAVSAPRKRRRIRQAVRRQLAERDGNRCSHVGPGGRRCQARAFLEIHHERPWALGGADTAENLQFLCRNHNRLQAELELGPDCVARAIEQRRNRKEA